MGTSVPTHIGRYKVLHVLGQGGMGIVYLAEDMRLKRKVAVKVIRKDASDNEFDNTLERFNREAEISARLNHPNIITVFDVGEDPEAGVFLAMEYIQGQSLASYLHVSRPSPEAGLMLLIQGMRALEAAGRLGILHRDIKPENMLVSQSGRLKLMDFGLARGDDSRITGTGVLLGTPAFSAPELIQGKEPSLDTDRYAFCVTAFEVMVGGLPFNGRTIGVTLYNIIHEGPEFPPGVSPELKQVFEKALAKNPADRYPNLTLFLVDLVQACPLEPAVKARILAKLDPLADEDAPALHAPSPGPEAATAPGQSTQRLASVPPLPPSEPDPTTRIRATPQATPRSTSAVPPRSTPAVTPAQPLVPKIRLSPPAPKAAPGKGPAPAAPALDMGKLMRGMKPAAPSASRKTPAPPPLLETPAPRPTPGPTRQPIAADEGGGVDPFAGIDWDEVLGGGPEAGNPAQDLVHDLEEGIQGADVYLAEAHIEEAEAREDLRALESGIRKIDLDKLLD